MANELIADKFLRLKQIMDELRSQCPWDKKQTIHSLRPMTIEEIYELAAAIDEENWDEIKEELGDIWLHLLFYTKIASEQEKFSLEDVLETITEKMIKRHPHIYGDTKVANEEDVKRNWQKIKLQEEGKKSVLSGVPKGMPSIAKSTRIQEKVKQVGFEWEQKEDVWKKVEEELEELKMAETSGNCHDMEEELGDVFFSLINYARFLKVDAEAALEKCNKKFITRFQLMETMAMQENKILTDLSLEEMDVLWNKAKKLLKNNG
ncbi:nucleoside triphosphate pyrophosphohydrolase [Arachidicoccus soli]|uniref:Nucleoside triphosphate pyrophosphohydrolase n=1 Tax=Arachidicoccus soli TaxID=2341117 RepID=A0A386HS84_9BACT|nr:nucleoside triphosphate pyrophosphohydrolase [Arachidicoccus soli]AYD48114.1 nucleoside triphosphate pyrophosphohydrolase [Arachidicoccus soli]